MQAGETVSLAIETHVREDAIRLFGFISEVERGWFRSLQTIQGVGSKVALAVLGTLSSQDSPRHRARRTGRQSSSRRASARSSRSASSRSSRTRRRRWRWLVCTCRRLRRQGDRLPTEDHAAAEAISALTNLGYKPAQASQAIAARSGSSGRAPTRPS